MGSPREAAELLADALARLQRGEGRTRPVSVSLPSALVDALGELGNAGVVPSTSAAATEALTHWAYNRLLRLWLDELYAEDPDARPTPEQVQAMADRLGVAIAPDAIGA